MNLKKVFCVEINAKNKLVISILGVKFTIKLSKQNELYVIMLKQYNFSFNTIIEMKNKLKFYERSQGIFIAYMLIRYFITGKISIPHLEYKLLTKCSLNCKECCHYAPYFKTQMEPVTFEYFKESLDKLLESVDYIYSFNFMGGDGLLHKDLPKMIEYAMTKKQIINFNFTSNSILIPNKDFINTVKNKDNFIVYISDYRGNENLKPILKVEQLEKLFKEENIHYYVLPDSQWYKAPMLSTNEKHDTKSKQCWLSGCKTYALGKMYFCPLQFYADFNKLPIENKAGEIVEVMNNDKNTVKNDLKAFYLKEQYDFCSNCKIFTNETVKNAEQVEKNIEKNFD